MTYVKQYSKEWQKQMGIFRASPAFDPDAVTEDDDAQGREVLEGGFVAALDKLEAVIRLSRVAGGGQEVLGPGSKERKSVLLTLRRALGHADGEALRKPEPVRLLASRLSVDWTDDCWSTGQTITLTGLNRLLQGAEPTLGTSAVEAASVESEAAAIAQVLVEVLGTCQPVRGS